MKSVKEFFYIAGKLGLGTSVSYLLYKFRLKFSGKLSDTKAKTQMIEKVYAVLFQMQNETVSVNGKEYIKALLPGSEKQIYLRPNSSDVSVLNDVIVLQEYKDVVKSYNQLFGNAPQTIIDCGGNVGLASIYLNTFYPGAKYIVVEPFSSNIDSIKLNFASCGIKDFTIIHGGVWNRDTQLYINREFGDGKEWAISLSENGNSNDIIEAFSLKRIIDEVNGGIDILKIDIEGGETILFENEGYASSFLQKVKCIAIEIHDEFNIRPVIYKVLQQNGFFYFDSNQTTIAVNRNFF